MKVVKVCRNFTETPSFLRETNPYILSEKESSDLELKTHLFNQATQNFPLSLGIEASKKARSFTLENRNDLTYGEVNFRSLAEVIYCLESRHGANLEQKVFYDLGSGTGKAVVAASLLKNFRKSVGIELLDPLYQISLEMQQALERVCSSKVEFFLGDMFELGWSEADLILVNSTCMSMELINKIADYSVKPGTWGITLSKSFNSSKWKQVDYSFKPMSWGTATVYMHQRVQD